MSSNHILTWLTTLKKLPNYLPSFEDHPCPKGGSVKDRGCFQAISIIYMGSLRPDPGPVPPSLHVLTEFLGVPAATAAKEIGITKGRLSQILLSNKPISRRFRIRLHAAARQGVEGWQKVSDAHSSTSLGKPFDEPIEELLAAVVHASNEFLRLDAEELGLDDNGDAAA